MATTMQPDIPWNVAGIRPEAREAARASARREGLSVGEWLTRRILRGVPETCAAADEWWFAENRRMTSNENPVWIGDRRETDGLRNLLPSPDESRHQDRGAPSGTAPIQSPARTDSEDIEQLNERIVRLDARLARIEIRAAAEEAKHAGTIQTLQAKVAELTGRLSRTAAHSARQDALLAKAVEAVSGKFLQSGSEADDYRAALNERIAALADETALLGEKLTESHDESERQLHAIHDRVAATEGAIETAAHARVDVERIGGSLDHLTRRFEANEAEYLENIERFESRLARVEANSGEATIDRRLQGIEQSLAEMTKLIVKSAPETAEPKALQCDAADPTEAHPHTALPGDGAAMPILDLPPFPERAKSSFVLPTDRAEVSPAHDPAEAPAPPDLRSATPGNSPFADSAKRPLAPEVESLLAAARRNARAGNSTEARDAPFSWAVSAGPKSGSEATRTRLVLLGGLGLLVFATIGAGFYLSSNVSAPPITSRPVHYAVVGTRTKLPHVIARPQVTTLPVSHPSRRPIARAAAVQEQPTGTLQQRLATLAVSGNAKAQEVLGLAYLDGDGLAVNEAEGAKWLERAAARGQAVAAWRLGTLYERGQGVAADPVKATQWYEVAAKGGNRKAMHNLAVAYAQGSGVRKDLSLAAQWFSRAANLGLADSEFNLAVLYERGLGVPQSLPDAYKWYRIAAAQGDTESRARVQAIASQLKPNDKAAAEKSAARFQPAPLDAAANAPPVMESLVGGA